MPYAYPEIRSFNGLFLQRNSFNLPDGALEVANNLVIAKDGILTKRRGFYEYFDPAAKTINNIHTYNNVLIAVLTDGVRALTDTGAAPNKTGSDASFSGTTVAVSGSRVARFAEANKNLYFTTNDGVTKIESEVPASTSIQRAGVPPALDLSATTSNTTTGVFPADTQVNYRIIFGRRDANDNLLLGAPSDFLALTNSLATGLSWANSGTTVTVTDTAHGRVVGQTIRVENAGDANIPDGDYTIDSVPGANSFTFIVSSAPGGSGTLDYGATLQTRLGYSIPSEISSGLGYFVQIYRTGTSGSSSSTAGTTYKFVEEVELSASDISNGFGFYSDVIPSILLGAELYTNPNSREGELQANDRPPLVDDIEFYKNHLIYAKATTRHIFNLDVIDTASITAGHKVQVTIDATTREYVARTGAANQTVAAESVSGTGTITVTYTNHGLSTGDTVVVTNVTGTVDPGSYSITVTGTNTFTFSDSGNTASALDFTGLTDTNSDYLFQLDNSSSSISVQLRNTAQGLVKAINRDSGSLVYARYISAPVNDVPGRMRLQAKGFGDPIEIAVSNASSGAGFSPTLTTTSTDNVSDNEDRPNFLYVSKISEPEAVPLLNSIAIGSANAEILAIRALRDSLIVLKEDGVFRLTGDTFGSLTATPLDSTVVCLAASSVKVLNNQVIFLSNQGVCLVTESSVQIISRSIEDKIQPILGNSALAAQTSAVAYETERLYILSTLDLNESTNTIVYAYNVLNDTWTTWDQLFDQGAVGPGDTLYLVNNSDNHLSRERKNQTLIDYTGQNFSATVVSIAADQLSGSVTVSGVTPQAGDVLVKDDVFTKITAVSGVGPTYSLTFQRVTNLESADTPTLYRKYDATWKLAPFHGGAIGRMKQFSQFQMHFKNSAPSKLNVTFTGYAFGGSSNIEWTNPLAYEGWGNAPFGFFPWGQADGVNLTALTQAAGVCRVYVPLFAQRTTFIQPVVEHQVAGEQINLQAATFAVRAYKERVSR